MSRTYILLAALAALAVGCGDNGLKSQDTAGRDQIEGAEPKADPVATVSVDSPGGGFGGLAVLPGSGKGAAAAPDAGPAVTIAERTELRAELDKALADDRLDDAIATADVLVILFPGDPEILELRGRALSRQGDAEGSARDLARCCELGRAACCGIAAR